MHGENDPDVPIAEAEQYYIALKDVGVETVFVRYPREGHGLRRDQASSRPARPFHRLVREALSARWHGSEDECATLTAISTWLRGAAPSPYLKLARKVTQDEHHQTPPVGG